MNKEKIKSQEVPTRVEGPSEILRLLFQRKRRRRRGRRPRLRTAMAPGPRTDFAKT